MLTISQLAAYAGVTVRAVRHYHAKGLLKSIDGMAEIDEVTASIETILGKL